MKRSSVKRYLTLSLASFAASVMLTSVCFQRRNSDIIFCFDGSALFFVTLWSRLMTDLQSFRFNCSAIDVSRCMRFRQLSSSLSGPTSSDSSSAVCFDVGSSR